DDGPAMGARDLAAQRLGISPDDVDNRMAATQAAVLENGLLDYPLATGTTYDPRTTDMVADMIEIAGWEHVDTPGDVRESLARISAPYTRDIAIAAEGGGPDLPPSRLPGLDQGKIDAFMREVSEDREARTQLAQNAAALVKGEINDSDYYITNDLPTAMGTGERLAGAYYRELGQAWDHVQVEWQEQREAIVNGWRTVTDPLVDVVTGKIVDKIPGANAIPWVDDITSGINESVNNAIYDNLIPEPELESMTTWRDAIEGEMYTAVADGLYDNPDARAHFINQEHQRLIAAAQANGQPPPPRPNPQSLEEFRRLPAVQNAVNTYGGEILDGFQSEMAFDRIFNK
ncbi:MAG: hypothetical protein ACRD0U_11450, partial [Acidimicrobiales bacterium]